LNLVPSRIWNNAIAKAELKERGYLVGKWKQYQTTLCYKKVSFQKVSFFITGKIPESQFQLVVFDIDVIEPSSVFNYVFNFAAELTQKFVISEPFWIHETGSGGFHLFYLFDYKLQIRNSESQALNAIAKRHSWIKHVNIRATGGFVFAPPSQFRGGKQYRRIRANPVQVNDAERFLEAR